MAEPGIAAQQVPIEVLDRAKKLFGMTDDEMTKALADPWNLLVILDICDQQE